MPLTNHTHLQQDLQTLVMSIVGSLVYGCVAMLVWRGGRPSVLEQGLQHIGMSAGGSKVNGGAALLVPQGGVCTGPKEHVHTLLVAIGNLRGRDNKFFCSE